MVQIQLNGRKKEVQEGISVQALILELGLRPQAVVVELNQGIVPREAYGEKFIQEKDCVEILHFVGGG